MACACSSRLHSALARRSRFEDKCDARPSMHEALTNANNAPGYVSAQLAGVNNLQVVTLPQCHD